jgi:hypothetical protein
MSSDDGGREREDQNHSSDSGHAAREWRYPPELQSLSPEEKERLFELVVDPLKDFLLGRTLKADSDPASQQDQFDEATGWFQGPVFGQVGGWVQDYPGPTTWGQGGGWYLHIDDTMPSRNIATGIRGDIYVTDSENVAIGPSEGEAVNVREAMRRAREAGESE